MISCDRRMGFGDLGKHDTARRHDGKESGAVSRRDHALARPDESRTLAIAASGSGRSAHRDAEERLGKNPGYLAASLAASSRTLVSIKEAVGTVFGTTPALTNSSCIQSMRSIGIASEGSICFSRSA